MAVREVPRSFLYECDVCFIQHTQENPTGHYTNSRPKTWCSLKFIAGDTTDAIRREEKLLCHDCGKVVIEAIDRIFKQRNMRSEHREQCREPIISSSNVRSGSRGEGQTSG